MGPRRKRCGTGTSTGTGTDEPTDGDATHQPQPQPPLTCHRSRQTQRPVRTAHTTTTHKRRAAAQRSAAQPSPAHPAAPIGSVCQPTVSPHRCTTAPPSLIRSAAAQPPPLSLTPCRSPLCVCCCVIGCDIDDRAACGIIVVVVVQAPSPSAVCADRVPHTPPTGTRRPTIVDHSHATPSNPTSPA